MYSMCSSLSVAAWRRVSAQLSRRSRVSLVSARRCAACAEKLGTAAVDIL